MAKKYSVSEQIKTVKFRVSFSNVFQAKANMQGDLKFGLTMLFDKKEDIAGIIAIVKAVAIEQWGAVPQGLKVPWSSGNKKIDKQTGEIYKGYENKIVVPASSKSRVGVVDCVNDPATGKLHVLTSEDEFYGGCYALATITAYTWDNIGGQGVSIGLQNVQKVGDGEPFSGKSNAEDDFDPIDKPNVSNTTVGIDDEIPF